MEFQNCICVEIVRNRISILYFVDLYFDCWFFATLFVNFEVFKIGMSHNSIPLLYEDVRTSTYWLIVFHDVIVSLIVDEIWWDERCNINVRC